jgi:hypothetical protein
MPITLKPFSRSRLAKLRSRYPKNPRRTHRNTPPMQYVHRINDQTDVGCVLSRSIGGLLMGDETKRENFL